MLETSIDLDNSTKQQMKRQHIVRRDDGSIVIINYEDFY